MWFWFSFSVSLGPFPGSLQHPHGAPWLERWDSLAAQHSPELLLQLLSQSPVPLAQSLGWHCVLGQWGSLPACCCRSEPSKSGSRAGSRGLPLQLFISWASAGEVGNTIRASPPAPTRWERVMPAREGSSSAVAVHCIHRTPAGCGGRLKSCR